MILRKKTTECGNCIYIKSSGIEARTYQKSSGLLLSADMVLAFYDNRAFDFHIVGCYLRH